MGSTTLIDTGPRLCPCGRNETVWGGQSGPPTCVGCSLIHHMARYTVGIGDYVVQLVADEIAEGMPATISIGSDSYPATVTRVKRGPSGIIVAISARWESTRSNRPDEEEWTLRSNGRYVKRGQSQKRGGEQIHVGVREDYRDPHF
jgi:hypothetical protein